MVTFSTNKAEMIEAILKNETYMTNSAVYLVAKQGLERLPLAALQSLTLILEIKLIDATAK